VRPAVALQALASLLAKMDVDSYILSRKDFRAQRHGSGARRGNPDAPQWIPQRASLIQPKETAMNHFNRIRLYLAAVALAALAPAAQADAGPAPAGDAVLAQVDAALNRAQTLRFEFLIINQEAGKAERTFGMTLRIKGEKRLAEFDSGAGQKYTKVLIRSQTQMYAHHSGFGAVRLLVNHTRDQWALGLCFSLDDLATTAYGPQYNAALAAETPTQWVLVLLPKQGQETSYAKIQMTVTKDKKVPSELKYFDATGKNIKTETRSGYSCEGDVCTPGEIKMTDNVDGSWTKVLAKSRLVNAEISDAEFYPHNLEQ
jgi:hypothetical protein